jgi:hypothetical protein
MTIGRLKISPLINRARTEPRNDPKPELVGGRRVAFAG